MICVGFDNDRILFLKINTKNTHRLGFSIKPITYQFLHHDSYIDCDNVWNILKIDEVLDQLNNNSGNICGKLTMDHQNEILKFINHRNCRQISAIHKRIINNSLGKTEK